MWQYFVLIVGLCALAVPSSGFWWPKTTTETPRGQVLQQIPLTYFRTYTYQPLTGGAFGVPLFGFGAAQTPLLSGRHYDPYAVTSYAAARRHDAAGTGFKTDVTPPALSSSSSSSTTTTTTTPAPTTTTTTTTTTPAPTTTTTTTTTTSSTTTPPPSSTTQETTSSLRYAAYNAEYPTYNRRVNNLYNARPQYPYPDYFNYQPQSTLSEKSGTRIQFVPCMCPVSMPSMSGLSNLGLSSATSTERDRPAGDSISTAPVGAADVLSARHIEGEPADIEEDEEETEAADGEAELDDATKVALEPQATTPAVESNSVV